MFALILASQIAHAASGTVVATEGNRLSKRAELRYEDVLTTRDGSRWRGKLIEKGEVYRIRLDEGSEVAIPQAQVVSVTRELHPGYPHIGQWAIRLSPGIEGAFVAATQDAGTRYGPYAELAITRNLGGPFEPELVLIVSPIGPEDGGVNLQLAAGARFYLQPNRRAKPFTNTQLVFYGTRKDVGLRTGPGFVFDVTPWLGIGIQQGVTLLTQTDPDAVGIGYHATGSVQGRF